MQRKVEMPPRRARPEGGELVAAGRPEDIADEPRSYTAQFLKELLARRPKSRAAEAAE
jgi:excinuclease ABC subunit A